MHRKWCQNEATYIKVDNFITFNIFIKIILKIFIISRLEEENHNLKEKHMKFSVQLQNEEINLPSSVAVSIFFILLIL